MRICIWLTAKQESVTNGEPTFIRRWVNHPCIPRIGENYSWLDPFEEEDMLYDLDDFEPDENIFRVADVHHVSVPRSLSSFLRGRPKDFPIVTFEVSDPRILAWLINHGTGWKIKSGDDDD